MFCRYSRLLLSSPMLQTREYWAAARRWCRNRRCRCQLHRLVAQAAVVAATCRLQPVPVQHQQPQQQVPLGQYVRVAMRNHTSLLPMPTRATAAATPSSWGQLCRSLLPGFPSMLMLPYQVIQWWQRPVEVAWYLVCVHHCWTFLAAVFVQ